MGLAEKRAMEKAMKTIPSWPMEEKASMRGKSFASTSESVTTSPDPPRLAKRFAPAAFPASTTDSTIVFQASQCGHWPCHLGDWPPHSVQV